MPKFEPLRISDILTSASILIAGLGLAHAWYADIGARERDLANQVREAAASTLAKVERLGDLSLSLLSEIQPFIVETTELVAETKKPQKARDYFWKQATRLRAEMKKIAFEEQIEQAYASLYWFYPRFRASFVLMLGKLKECENQFYIDYMTQTEMSILAVKGVANGFYTAPLGNRLRLVSRETGHEHERCVNIAVKPVIDDLYRIMAGESALPMSSDE